MSSIQSRLQEMNITLPTPPAPAANYVPYTTHSNTLYISGQLPIHQGQITHKGKLEADLSLDEGIEAARLCAINILAVAAAALEDLERIEHVLKLGGFVASTPDFTKQPLVVNGASDLIAKVLEKRGLHARFAVGVPVLPLNVAVEIDAVIAYR